MSRYYYYVESWSGWFVCWARLLRKARSEGVAEFGRGKVKSVRPATEGEVEHYESQKGPVLKHAV